MMFGGAPPEVNACESARFDVTFSFEFALVWRHRVPTPTSVCGSWSGF